MRKDCHSLVELHKGQVLWAACWQIQLACLSYEWRRSPGPIRKRFNLARAAHSSCEDRGCNTQVEVAVRGAVIHWKDKHVNGSQQETEGGRRRDRNFTSSIVAIEVKANHTSPNRCQSPLFSALTRLAEHKNTKNNRPSPMSLSSVTTSLCFLCPVLHPSGPSGTAIYSTFSPAIKSKGRTHTKPDSNTSTFLHFVPISTTCHILSLPERHQQHVQHSHNPVHLWLPARADHLQRKYRVPCSNPKHGELYLRVPYAYGRIQRCAPLRASHPAGPCELHVETQVVDPLGPRIRTGL